MKIFCVDPDLKDATGHSLNLNSAIFRSCSSREIPFVVFADHRFEGCLPWVRPHFKTSKVFSNFLGLGREIAQLWWDFCRLLGGADRHTAIFLPNATYRQLLALVLALPTCLFAWPAQMVILLRYTDKIGNGYHKRRHLSRFLLWLIGLAPGRLRVVTDSGLLAEEFSTISPVKVETLPIPLLPSPEPQAFSPSPHTPVRLLFAGDARVNKGFLLLAEALPQLRPFLEEGRLELTVQANLRPGCPRPLVEAREWILSLQWPGLRVLPRPLEIEEYQDELQRCDALILPYLGEEYIRQTSGPFSEGVAAGKIVLVPQDTWMAYEAGNLNCGLLMQPDVPGIKLAIERLLDDFASLGQKAQQASQAWRSVHSAENFVSRLVGEVA